MSMKIRVKRVYEKPALGDGFRVLVDRLWPRGLSKNKAKIGRWLKGVAPSPKLRVWFHADKAKRLAEFGKRYKKEISGAREIAALQKMIREKPRTTLVTAVKDFERSHISILLRQLHSRGRRPNKPDPVRSDLKGTR